MKVGMQNIWMGNEESLGAIMRLNAFLESPTQNAKAFWGDDDDDDEEEEPRFKGIGSHLIQVEDGVGIINIEGSLTNRYSWFNRYFGVVSYGEIRDALVSLAQDSEISEILLEVSTGGGAAHGVNEVSELISQIDKVKAVSAHISMYAFSAGMWIASAARKISASNMSESGSIGVIITMASYHEMYKKAGIDVKVIRAGKYKALGNPAEPLSEAALQEAEGKADKLYGYFLDQMVRGRPQLSIANKDAWAEGKTFFADEAIVVGMIDEIESFDKVVANLLANHDNNKQEAQFSVADTSTDNGDPMTKGTKKTVLTPEALAAAALSANVKTEETPVDPAAPEAAVEPVEPEAAEPVKPEASADAPEPTMNLDSFIVKLTELTNKNAALEVELGQLKTENTKLSGEVTALKPIACQTINRLEVALCKGVTELGAIDSSALADMHAALNTTFEETFSVGQPRSSRLPEGRDAAANVDNTFCTIHKPKA